MGITYQFAVNGMIGAGGTFTNLHYLDPAAVPGLFDSTSQGGSGFYMHRISKMHYIGFTYEYQRLLSYPAPEPMKRRRTALLFLYTLYATSRFSISFFGGPQYADIGPQFSDDCLYPNAGLAKLEPAGWGQLKLARATDQSCRKLLAHDLERRGPHRSGEDG